MALKGAELSNEKNRAKLDDLVAQQIVDLTLMQAKTEAQIEGALLFYGSITFSWPKIQFLLNQKKQELAEAANPGANKTIVTEIAVERQEEVEIKAVAPKR
jgi:hypothetical protein